MILSIYKLEVDNLDMKYIVVLFRPGKSLCRYGCMYFLAALVLVCVDVIVMS